MKRTLLTIATLALAVPALAQDDFHLGTLDFGLLQRDSDTLSSKFLEYRDIPQGAVLNMFRLQGKKGDYRYHLYGKGVTQADQLYVGLVEGMTWKLTANYVGIPHSFGNAGLSILNPVGQYEWRISDSLQQQFQNAVAALPSAQRTYPFLLAIVQPTLNGQPANIDLKLQRNRTNLAFSVVPGGGSFDVAVSYFHERRSGSRTANGTSFGFNNVVETPEPIRFVTQDFAVNATLTRAWGVAFAGFNVNDFSDKYDTFVFDNPFRAVDSTGNAYQSPSSTSIAGPVYGLAGTPPSSQAWNVKGGTTLKLGAKSRLSADATVGKWTQDEQPFIAYTTNTSVRIPDGRSATDPANLPARRLDGQIDVLALNGFFTTRVGQNVRLNARYRLYENENQTPRIRFEQGYTRFDADWNATGRITVPNGIKSNLFDAYATFDAGRALGLEAGYKYNKLDRTFRETEHTTENTFRLAADLRFGDGVLLRGLYEFGERDFEDYHPVEAEENSFLAPGPPVNQTVLRRYDQAKRDRNRLGVQLQLSPASGKLSLGAGYFLNKDEYDESPVSCNADYHDGNVGDSATFCSGGVSPALGLMKAEYETFSLDASFAPTERATLYGFYSREDIMDFQTGRQSGASVTFDPAWNWSSTVEDKVDTIGAGADVTLVPDKWYLSVSYRHQKVDGNNDLSAGSQARPASTGPVEDVPDYDDTKINAALASLRWQFKEGWSVAVGGYWEDYEYKDSQTGQVLNYMPGSFFLNAVSGSYSAWVGYASLTRKW